MALYEIVRSPWESTFVRLLRNSVNDVLLASPFIKTQTARLVVENCRPSVDIKYINAFKLASFHRGASDLEALRILDQRHVVQKNVQSLHAKLFVFDNEAIVTSGNLTPGGLRNNIEYGLIVRDALVEEIRADYLRMFDDPDSPFITLEVIQKAEDILASVPKDKRPRIGISDAALFDGVLNDENAEEKYKGGVDSILRNLSPWRRHVFECLLEITEDVFTLSDLYRYEDKLGRLHPLNRNVQPKIRQQLQELREIGLVEFLGSGRYKKLWA